MNRLILPMILLLLLAACDVPQPPPELRDPTVTPAGRPAEGTTTRVPPTATTPPDGGGRVWFVRDTTVWAMGPDGANPQARGGHPASSAPAPAPDGRRVAYLSDRQLIVLDRATGSERVVAEGAMAARQVLGWSPDGAQIAYFTEATTVDATGTALEPVWVVSTDGSTPPQQMLTVRLRGEQVGSSFTRQARWSPDGRRFAAAGLYGPIQAIPLSATAGDPFTVNGGEPDWSPNSRYLLHTQTLGGALSIFDAVGGAATPFTNEKRQVGTGLVGYGAGPGARYSPDGGQILYRSRTADGGPAVAVRDLSGNESLYLPGNNPVWSPDGGWIVYETGVLTTTARGLDWQATGLAKVRADGSNMAQLLQNARLPAWSR